MAPKNPKRPPMKEDNTRKRSITIQKKKDIVEKYESGVRVTELSQTYGLPKSTISTILKNKDLYKRVHVAKGIMQIKKLRSTVIDEVERRLLVWMDERQMAGDNLSESIICKKARAISADLVKDSDGDNCNKTFSASKGWFHNFKTRISTPAEEADVADKKNFSNEYNADSDTIDPLSECPQSSQNYADYSKPSKKKKRKEADEVDKKRSNKTTAEDNHDVFGKNLAHKLRHLPNEQRIYLEKIINDAIFEAEMGNLSRDCYICVPAMTKQIPNNAAAYTDYSFPVPHVKFNSTT